MLLLIRREQMRALAQAREADLAARLVGELRREHEKETAPVEDERLQRLVEAHLSAARQARLPLEARGEYVKRNVLERLAPGPANSAFGTSPR